MSLKAAAITGFKWTTFSMIAVTAIQLARLSILARLLSPDDFGLMAIMMVIIGFTQAFADAGISNAIIHKQHITHSQLSSLYWLNLAFGFLLTAIVASASHTIANFYVEPRIADLMTLLSVVYIVAAAGSQYRVLCQKELQLDRIAKIDVIASSSSLFVAVAFAVEGYGIYSLVFALLAETLVASALFVHVGLRDYHRPALTYRHNDVKGFYGFGLFQMGERSVNYLSANFDKMLIGKVLGAYEVGFYNLAWQLVIFPLSKINPVINKVAFPVYAKVQHDRQALNNYYSFSVKLLSIVTIPLIAFLFFFASEIVLIVFGPGWDRTINVVSILAFVGGLKALGNPGGTLLLALGRADIGFWWNLVWAIAVAATLVLTLYIFPSIDAVAYALLVLSLSIGMIWHVAIAKIGGISYLPIIAHFAKVAAASGLACLSAYWIVEQIDIEHPVFRLATAIVCVGIGYFGYLMFFEKNLLRQITKEGD